MRAWAEINLSAIAHNTKEIRKVTNKNAKIMAMVKADGYGHGAAEVAKTVLENGADCLGVACAEEACELRERGVTAPILIAGYTPLEDVKTAVSADAALTVYSYEAAKYIDSAAKDAGKIITVHIKVDTGMTRLGFDCSPQSLDEAHKICGLKNIYVEGIFSHLARAEEADGEPSLLQFKRFREFAECLEKRGVHIPVKHICNSAGIIKFPQMHLDMVRPGICIYGELPSNDVDKIDLMPAMSIKCTVARVLQVRGGTEVSYGATFKAEGDMKIATVLIGYGDGIRRRMSDGGRIIIGGRAVPIIGTVCMDLLMADVTGMDVSPEDEAVIMGRQGDAFISASQIAQVCQTISYEIFCNAGKRLVRVCK